MVLGYKVAGFVEDVEEYKRVCMRNLQSPLPDVR